MSMSMSKQIEFTGLRNILWPIYRRELKYFFSMSVLMFLILFNQNILRILKDSIVIPEISVEVTNFAKIYCVMPTAALFLYAYTKMANNFALDKIFSIFMIGFISYFICFAFLLYPFFEIFHVDRDTTQLLMSQYLHFKWFIAMSGYWSLILFYTLAELWPNIFYILLFWQLANNLTSTEDAKRFYTLFALFGNTSLLFVGYIMMYFSDGNYLCNLCGVEEDKHLLAQNALLLVVIAGIFSSYLFNKIYHNSDYISSVPSTETKLTLSFRASMQYIVRSKYLWLILIGSAAFGVTLNLVESVWKSKIKELYPTVNSYAYYNSQIIIWTGYTILAMTILGNNIMRRKGWLISAMISPILIIISGLTFFVLLFFEDNISTSLLATTPLVLTVFIGAIQNVLSKGTKYSIWDTSREMLFIPLDQELKTKGKAAVDIVSSKVGKAFSSLTQHIIFIIFPLATYSSISGILGLVFALVCICWIYSLKTLNTEYTLLLKKKAQVPITTT